MAIPGTEPAAKNKSRNVIPLVLVLAISLWCIVVVYAIVCVSYLGVIYPLGRSMVANLIYSTLLKDPMFPDRTKLDLPIALIHTFAFFKCSQWLWRQRRFSEKNSS
jgi:Trk-type K+ transport system membrane component